MRETSSPEQAAALRRKLLEQVTYLSDEVEALRTLINRVPKPLLEGRPMETDWSIKEIFGLIAAYDEDVHLPRLQQIVAEDAPYFEPEDEATLVGQEAWNEHPIDDILVRVHEARRRLVKALRALPPEEWQRAGTYGDERYDVYAFAYAITQQDVAYLRTVGYRLHESNLTGRPQDVPK